MSLQQCPALWLEFALQSIQHFKVIQNPLTSKFMEDESSLCFAVSTSSCHWFTFSPTALVLVLFNIVLRALLLFSSLSLVQAAASAALLAGALTFS